MLGPEVINSQGYNIPFTIYVILIFLITIAFTSYRTTNVKKKLKSKIPRVSICLNQCIIKIIDDKIEINTRNLEVLMEIAKLSKLYLIAELPDQITQDQLLQAIYKDGSKILKHRIMSCSTSSGRGSMVRQLQPFLHAEVDKSVVEYLTGKIANVMYLEESGNYDLGGLLEIVRCAKINNF